MFGFAFRHMSVRLAKLIMIALSIVITCCVALLAYNISTQVSEGIIQTAADYDMIIGPAGSSTQLAMNTMFFTDKPLGTIPYSIVDELNKTGLVNSVVPFSMGDSFNDAPIVGTSPALLDGKALAKGEMFAASLEAVVGYDVAKQYDLKIGDSIVTSHGLEGNGHSHAESPLTVVGILDQTHTAYDGAVFTPCETIWALHDHSHDHAEDETGDEHAHETEEEHAHETEEHAHETSEEACDETCDDPDHDHDGHTICAVLVRSKSIAAYTTLTAAYSENSDYLVINPNTVLREVLENVDMSRTIVYILCGVILVMNVFVITLIAMLNAYDSRGEIALMRLIGVSMKKINLLYLIQNALAGAVALILALAAEHLCLMGIRSFVASMGIVLNAGMIYPMEWIIVLAVFVLSILPTSIMTLRMSRRDSIDR